MAEKNERKPYVEPTLDKREELIEITEGVVRIASGAGGGRG